MGFTVSQRSLHTNTSPGNLGKLSARKPSPGRWDSWLVPMGGFSLQWLFWDHLGINLSVLGRVTMFGLRVMEHQVIKATEILKECSQVHYVFNG